MAKLDQPIDVAKLVIDLPDNLRGGVYANTLTVVSTNTEITLNFAYINQADKVEAVVVSRVIIPPIFAENIAKSLTEVIKKSQQEVK